jgi:hypothetical protein
VWHWENIKNRYDARERIWLFEFPAVQGAGEDLVLLETCFDNFNDNVFVLSILSIDDMRLKQVKSLLTNQYTNQS